MTTSGILAQSSDIVSPTAEIALGSGWFSAETYAGTTFRWVENDAEFLVATVHPVLYALVATIEPGPGVGVKPFDLEVRADGEKRATLHILGKMPVRVELPGRKACVQRVTLHALGGGAKTPGDPRILNFRVFSIAVERGSRDVLPAHMALGQGWYPLERHAGMTFRWVDNDAQISLDSPDANDRLSFDVEPGPGLNGRAFVLHVVRPDGSKIEDINIRAETQHVDIAWPKGEKIVALHVDSKGLKSPGESRVLNFRIFASQ